MSTPLKQHKTVGTLPATLEPDSIYWVRVGAGFDVYVTNSVGLVVAQPLNHPPAPTLTTTSFTLAPAVGWVNVNADGTIAGSAGAGIAATRTAVGRYTLTPPPGALTVSLDLVEAQNTRDDIIIRATDFVGSTVHISEQDNGGAAGVFRDRNFMAKWFGNTQTVLTGAALV